MKPHTNLLKDIMRTAPANVRLFQNDQGNVETIDGRRIKYGLQPGSGDLCGWTVIRGVAVFTSIEGKVGKDRVRPDQKKWASFVQSQGGIAIIARSVEECWQLHTAATNELLANFNPPSP